MSSANCSMAPCIAVPAPPPPLSNFAIKSKECRQYAAVNINLKPRIQRDCDWALQFPEIQKASALAHICVASTPKYFRMKHDIQAIIQDGPTCGLTALTMLTGGTPSAQDILALAKQNNFSNHGEMFSVKNFKKLAENVFDLLGHQSSVEAFSGKLNCDRIRTELMNGACILVAYDSDFNHAPCLKNGHKAHWALIIGCLIDDCDRFHVFVRHGKTRNLALWPLTLLSDSNSNLNEYTAPHRYNEYLFQMPIDGIAGKNGLKNQCIIITGVETTNDIICSME